jgi:hypothetical protein
VPGEVSTHVGAFDLALFAALVGDDDDDLDDLTSEQIEAGRRAIPIGRLGRRRTPKRLPI